jgi:hypothetical protein
MRPDRIEAFKFSTDPDLEGKVRDVVGLYLAPPANAVVVLVDEKSQIQALDRTARCCRCARAWPRGAPMTTSSAKLRSPPPARTFPRWVCRDSDRPTAPARRRIATCAAPPQPFRFVLLAADDSPFSKSFSFFRSTAAANRASCRCRDRSAATLWTFSYYGHVQPNDRSLYWLRNPPRPGSGHRELRNVLAYPWVGSMVMPVAAR